MKRREKNVEDHLGLFGSLSEQELAAAEERASHRFRSAPVPATTVPVTHEVVLRPMWHWRAGFAAAVAAAILVVVFVETHGTDARAVVESADGSRKIGYGEVVHAAEGAGDTVVLSDGSRVEMRTGSELSLERANDGVRIRLNKGDVIVSAAKQHGHLYVQTKDVTVSVVGTVFLVKAEEAGSRVAVIQGEVQVQQDGASKELRPGEQAISKPIMEWRSVSEELSWSRHAEKHLALLQQSAKPSGAVPPTTPRAVFEVASIRRSAPPAAGVIAVDGPTCHGVAGFEQVDPRRFVASGTTLFTLVMDAYGMDCVLVDGGPEWIRSDGFDVQALIPAGSPVYTQQDLIRGNAPGLQRMIQSLLADSFRLAVHREMKEMPHYDLVVVKSGKMKLSEDQSLPYASAPSLPPRPGGADFQLPRGAMSLRRTASGDTILALRALPMSELARILQGRLATGRIVVDKTGLKGLFDIRLEFGPDTSLSTLAGPTSVPLLTAIQEQLGLKLESTRSPVEVLEIDHAEKPSEN